jgi:PAS domain S-box-containing protein
MPEFANPEVYQAVLEELLTGVYLVDCEQKVRFWNSGAERITGYLRHEMIGRPLPKDILSTPIAYPCCCVPFPYITHRTR